MIMLVGSGDQDSRKSCYGLATIHLVRVLENTKGLLGHGQRSTVQSVSIPSVSAEKTEESYNSSFLFSFVLGRVGLASQCGIIIP
jgi:hypothetical protein